MDQPLWKNAIWRPLYIVVFIVQKGYYSIQNVTKPFFSAYFAEKERLKKRQIFDEKHGLTPWDKWKFGDCFALMFLEKVAKLAFSLRDQLVNGWCQKPWTNPFGKMRILRSFILMFLWARKGSFLFRTSRNTFARPIWLKKKIKKCHIFVRYHDDVLIVQKGTFSIQNSF